MSSKTEWVFIGVFAWLVFMASLYILGPWFLLGSRMYIPIIVILLWIFVPMALIGTVGYIFFKKYVGKSNVSH